MPAFLPDRYTSEENPTNPDKQSDVFLILVMLLSESLTLKYDL